jgi:hypothetical protein
MKCAKAFDSDFRSKLIPWKDLLCRNFWFWNRNVNIQFGKTRRLETHVPEECSHTRTFSITVSDVHQGRVWSYSVWSKCGRWGITGADIGGRTTVHATPGIQRSRISLSIPVVYWTLLFSYIWLMIVNKMNLGYYNAQILRFLLGNLA